jgi:hypothetical protein
MAHRARDTASSRRSPGGPCEPAPAVPEPQDGPGAEPRACLRFEPHQQASLPVHWIQKWAERGHSRQAERSARRTIVCEVPPCSTLLVRPGKPARRSYASAFAQSALRPRHVRPAQIVSASADVMNIAAVTVRTFVFVRVIPSSSLALHPVSISMTAHGHLSASMSAWLSIHSQ